MRFPRLATAAIVLVALLASAAVPQSVVVEYQGMCDASAAVSVGRDLFLVANDEDTDRTALRLYRRGQAGFPLRSFPIANEVLGLTDSHREVDLEGAARLDDLVFWIGSHSTNAQGKPRPNRRRLFATRVVASGETIAVETVGQAYKTLLEDLAQDPEFQRFHLDHAAKTAPKDPGGLSIEGLAATPQGDLLIGFRNPIPDKKALLVRLKNPRKVIEGKPGKFGKPILLDLDGLGVRSLAYWPRRDLYLIVAGPDGEVGPFRLYRWSGKRNEDPKPIHGIDFDLLTPEALFVDDEEVEVLSDDGRRTVDGQDCKALPDNRQRFRGLSIRP